MDILTPELNDKEFKHIAALVYDAFGIVLNQEKKSLVINRLGKTLRDRSLPSFAAYIHLVENDRSGAELSLLANAISTNHTFFYREPKHFDHLSQVALPDILKKQRAKSEYDLRVWCAASSTGEEPWTLAMLIREALGSEVSRWHAGLLATDISTRALNTAYRGAYGQDEVDQLPPEMRRKWFRSRGDGLLEVVPELRSDLLFRRLNLVKEFKFKKPFHIIFIRNVMIYFDQQTKEDLARRLAQWVVPGGYLYIGHSESLGRNSAEWESMQPAVYRRKA